MLHYQDLLASLIEWGIDRWVRITGRNVAPTPSWLSGPIGGPTIGRAMYDEYARTTESTVAYDPPHAGLLADFQRLAGPYFDPSRVHPAVIDFYEHTADYTLDAWSAWSGPLKPFASLLVALISPRMQQFNLPLSPLDGSRGMRSTIVRLTAAATQENEYTGWLRTDLGSGAVIYAGFYTLCCPPGSAGPCVKVVFPVPRGNVTVILAPEVGVDGALLLRSAGHSWGETGYYRLYATAKDRLYARFLRLHETIHVYQGADGILKTDHTFRFLGGTFLRLHYKISRKPSG